MSNNEKENENAKSEEERSNARDICSIFDVSHTYVFSTDGGSGHVTRSTCRTRHVIVVIVVVVVAHTRSRAVT